MRIWHCSHLPQELGSLLSAELTCVVLREQAVLELLTGAFAPHADLYCLRSDAELFGVAQKLDECGYNLIADDVFLRRCASAASVSMWR